MSERGVIIVKHGPVASAIHLTSAQDGGQLVEDLWETLELLSRPPGNAPVKAPFFAGYLTCMLAGNGHQVEITTDRHEPERPCAVVLVVDTSARQVRAFSSAAYGASKALYRMLTDTLAPEVAWSFDVFVSRGPKVLTATIGAVG